MQKKMQTLHKQIILENGIINRGLIMSATAEKKVFEDIQDEKICEKTLEKYKELNDKCDEVLKKIKRKRKLNIKNQSK